MVNVKIWVEICRF